MPLERRGEIRELIGARSERLAYLNSAMDRSTFDRAVMNGDADGVFCITDRITGEELELTRDECDDLCRVHLCDWLEQAPRSQEWSYRREAHRRVADRLGGAALESYQRVFSQEPTVGSP